MSPLTLLDVLGQLPANLGDPQGMRVKAAQLDHVAARVDRLNRGLAAAVAETTRYRGPAADEFRRAMQARHEEMSLLIRRIQEVRERLHRAAAVMQSAEDQVDAVRRRVQRDFDSLGGDAGRLVIDAQQLARQVLAL